MRPPNAQPDIFWISGIEIIASCNSDLPEAIWPWMSGAPRPNDEATIAQLKETIARTINYLKIVPQSEIEGTENRDISITFPSGQTGQSDLADILDQANRDYWIETWRPSLIDWPVDVCGADGRYPREE